MDVEIGITKRHKKLVVHFYDNEIWSLADCIQTDDYDHPQLVHPCRCSRDKRRSSIDRLATRLGFKKKNKPPTGEVASAYAFLTQNYAPGDDVILLVDSDRMVNSEPLIANAELLARYLYSGIFQYNSSKLKTRDGAVPVMRIPIHCVAVREPTDRISARDELQLKTRFPPGIERIVRCAWYDDTRKSYSTVFDSDGGVISREICFSTNAYPANLFIYSTQHIIHYRPDKIPTWDEQGPTWTCELPSPPNGSQDVLSLESKPAGRYRHELRRYELSGNNYKGDPVRFNVLVWKSSR